jgi:hypothetical protein
LLSRLSYRSLQRLLAIVITLHNAEEGLTASWYLPLVREYIARIPLLRDSGLVPPSLARLYFALVVVTVVPALLIGWATTGRDSVAKRASVIAVAAALLWNVFLPHLSEMIVLGGYAPGGITALAVNFPFCVYLLRRTWREKILTRRQMTIAVMGGVLLLMAAPLLLLL